ncbi:hypothetical protein [Stenoxybacter acetivorans]|uniref:hypothetical protein n=1 Tax=Stenoxybacter acetivorans TaxID=422441 RepID=UPI00056CAB7F|nr:hypothetical protein [Stenoxybacter acetivorans]
MALTRAEIQKRSDEKRGMVMIGIKINQVSADYIRAAAQAAGLPIKGLIECAVREFAENHGLDIPIDNGTN